MEQRRGTGAMFTAKEARSRLVGVGGGEGRGTGRVVDVEVVFVPVASMGLQPAFLGSHERMLTKYIALHIQVLGR